jgi:hypothetical protein
MQTLGEGVPETLDAIEARARAVLTAIGVENNSIGGLAVYLDSALARIIQDANGLAQIALEYVKLRRTHEAAIENLTKVQERCNSLLESYRCLKALEQQGLIRPDFYDRARWSLDSAEAFTYAPKDKP